MAVPVLVLGACGSATTQANHLVSDASPASMPIPPKDALDGRLDVSERGCVVLVVDGRELLLWAPAGSELVDGGGSVQIAGWDTYELGDEVELRGKEETVGMPIRRNQPLNYRACVPQEDRQDLRAALVAETAP